MKQKITLFLAGSAIALSGAAFAGNAPSGAHGFVFEGPAAQGLRSPLIRVSGDDEDEDEGGFWSGSQQIWSGDDEGGDEGDDCGGDDDDEDEGGCSAGGAGNAAPAGTVAPPKNGLFTDGTAPQVKTN